MGCDNCPNGQLHERVGLLEQGQARMMAVLENLDRNMSELVQIGKAQVRLETQQIEHGKAIDRAFGAIDDQGATLDARIEKVEGRVGKLEADAPTTNLARDWLFDAGKWLVAAAVGGALVKAFT